MTIARFHFRGLLMRKLFWIHFFVATVGCTNSSFHTSNPSSTSSSQKLSGMVSLGPVSNSSVSVHKVNSDGSRGEEVATTTTDSNGKYQVDIPSDATTIEVVATGGSYKEESSGAEVSMHLEEVSALVDNVSTHTDVAVTVLTEIAANRSKELIEAGSSVSSAITTAQAEVQEATGVSDILESPADPTSSVTTTSSESAQYAVVLAGISELAQDKDATSIQITEALVEDFKNDGQFDGSDSGNPVALQNSAQVLTGTEWSTDLPTKMTEFVNNTSTNVAGFTVQSIPTTVPKPTNSAPTNNITSELVKPTPTTIMLGAGLYQYTNRCMPLLIRSTDSKGLFAPVSSEKMLSLASSNTNVNFYSDLDCSSSISTATINAYTAYTHVFIKSTITGAATLTVSDLDTGSALASGTKDLNFQVAPSLAPAPTIDLSQKIASKVILMLPPFSPVTTNGCQLADVHLVNSQGYATPYTSDLTITLSSAPSSGIQFFSDPQCQSNVTQLTLPALRIGQPFFFRTTQTGDYSVTAAAPPLISSNRSVKTFLPESLVAPTTTVIPSPTPTATSLPPATALKLMGPTLATEGICYPVAVKSVNSANIATPVQQQTTVNLALQASSTGSTFYADGLCLGSTITSVNIPAFYASQTFFVKFAATAPTITASAASLNSASYTTTVAAAITPNPAAAVRIKAPPTLIYAGCSPMYIEVVDSAGAPTPTPTNISIAFSISGTYQLYSDDLCSLALTTTSVAIQQGTAVRRLFVKGNANTPPPTTPQSLSLLPNGFNPVNWSFYFQ